MELEALMQFRELLLQNLMVVFFPQLNLDLGGTIMLEVGLFIWSPSDPCSLKDL